MRATFIFKKIVKKYRSAITKTANIENRELKLTKTKTLTILFIFKIFRLTHTR